MTNNEVIIYNNSPSQELDLHKHIVANLAGIYHRCMTILVQENNVGRACTLYM